jgi:hypothetical protein
MTSEQSDIKRSKKQELLDQLKLLENEEEEPEIKIEEANPEIKVYEPKKPKRIVKARSEKQIESLAQGRLKRDLHNIEKRQIKEQGDIILKQELEKKLIDKAIKIKKKQLKKIEMFNELSDDETPPTIQKPKPKPSPVIVAPKPVVIDPYSSFKNKFNIR